MREDVDPRIDKMIAFLYGELPPAEEKAFRRLLEKDDALRAEWEELSGTRETLTGWKVEEHVPSFVLVDSGAKAKAAAPAGTSAWRRFLDSLRPVAMSPTWGLAAAALALVVLAVGGFRVERVPQGLAFRFGGDRPATTSPPALPGVGDGQPMELAARPSTTGTGAPGIVPVSGAYLTQEEFNAYNTDLMTTLVGLLNRYDEQRDKETTDLLQGLYSKINERQMYDYERTNRRIDALGAGLLLESNRTKTIDDVLEGANRPARDPAPGAGKE